jgi:hypothetical protein
MLRMVDGFATDEPAAPLPVNAYFFKSLTMI